MTSSTCSTVSAEEVKRFAEEKARELGLTELLHMEAWANPVMQQIAAPATICKLRNGQLRLHIRREKVRSTF